MQHSCLALLEITDTCNLRCPVCYAGSGPAHDLALLADVERMLDALSRERDARRRADLGGEPTLHPDFFAILDAAAAGPSGTS